MTYEQLVKLAASWNKDGKRDTSIKEAAVLDVLDQAAVAKVTASWGIDYMMLGKSTGDRSWETNRPAAEVGYARSNDPIVCGG